MKLYRNLTFMQFFCGNSESNFPVALPFNFITAVQTYRFSIKFFRISSIRTYVQLTVRKYLGLQGYSIYFQLANLQPVLL